MIKLKFAWLPTRLYNQEVIWLEYYWCLNINTFYGWKEFLRTKEKYHLLMLCVKWYSNNIGKEYYNGVSKTN